MKRTLGMRTSNIFFGLGGCSLVALASMIGCGGGTGETGGAGTTSSTTTTSSETTTSSSTTTTTSNTGGTGPAMECDVPSDCPATASECILPVCVAHLCGTVNAPAGTLTATQSDGDCKRNVCDGAGATKSVNDDSDIANDNKQCTADICSAGSISHDPLPAGAPCFESGGKICDGKGACVVCNADADCATGSVCSGGACVAPTCTDGVLNGGEISVDCGGPNCAPCALDATCVANKDCGSGLCAVGKCAASTPIINNISANGHDRLFNLAFDAMGNIFGVGVQSADTTSTADFSTIVVKFTPQGKIDTTFGTNGVFNKNITVGTNGELARAIGFQSTGKIIVGATVEQVGAADARDRDAALMRVNADGTLDTTFGTNGVAIINLSNGVVAGNGFAADSMWHLAVQPDDKIVFHGSQVRTGGTDTDYVIARVLPNGAMDTTFGTNGKVSIDIGMVNASARSLTLNPDGSILGGGYADINGVGTPVAWKVTAAGVLDTTWGTGGIYNAVVLPAQTEVYALAPQGNKYVTIGYGRSSTSESLDWTSLRFLSNGALDPTYGENGLARIDYNGFNDQARDVIVLPDGRILLSGGARPTSANVDGAIGILTANGLPDTSWAPNGVRLYDLGGANDFIWDVALAPSKDYVAAIGIKGIATGGAGNDDTALVLIPIK